MHRLLAVLFTLAAALTLTVPATAQTAYDDIRRGLVYDGLERAAVDSLCGGAFQAVLEDRLSPSMKDVLCTHGPDPAPEGVDVTQERGPDPAAERLAPAPGTAAETGAVQCYGSGSDGFRVQLVYARSSSASDRFATYQASFRSWAARLDQVVEQSAAKTGGSRHVRFVTDAACNPVVARVSLSPGAMSSFSSMVSELHSLGYARTDRKYLVWADANVYCGISELYLDDTPDPTPGQNYNNGNPRVQGTIGRVDNGCWGLSHMVEAHELLHLLGGVQPSAPHATPSYHCLDESDRLCYADGSTSSPLRQVCPASQEALWDCNGDDYFSTAPPRSSYLARHWNTANSAFLSAQAPTGPALPTTVSPPPPPPPPPTTVAPPPPVPSTTTTTPVAPPPSTTTTTASPATPTTQPPSGATAPSAPQGLVARQPGVGRGVVLAWEAPTSGPVTGYRIYRGTSPYTQALLAEVGNVLGYSDSSAGPALYFYRVTAFNAAGEGSSSPLAGMIGKAGAAAGMAREDVRQFTIVGSRVRWA
jgi:hypothetical protein